MIIIFGLASVFIVTVALLLPKEYTSRATILPPSDEGIGGGFLSRYSSVASLVGISLPSGSVGPRLYESILKSRYILEPIITDTYQTEKFPGKKVNLVEYFEIEEDTPEMSFEVTLIILQDGVLDITTDVETSLTELEVTTREPALSMAIAKRLVVALEDFNQNNIQKESRERKAFIANRIEELTAELDASEKRLRVFLDNVRDITRPEAQIKLNRLQREIELQGAIFVEMKKQEEIYKVKEFTDLAPLKVLDWPYAPQLRSWPKRSLLVLAFMTGFGIIVMAVYIVLFYRNQMHQEGNSHNAVSA